MGTLQSIKPLEEIERDAPGRFREEFKKIRESINELEIELSSHFSEVDSATAISHMLVQQSLRDYAQRLRKEFALQTMKKCKTFPVDFTTPDFYSPHIENFTKYLQQFGEVEISDKGGFWDNTTFSGMFLRVNDLRPEFIGVISLKDDYHRPIQLEYAGYVPTRLSELEFFKHTYKQNLWHLSEPPKIEGMNLVFVRLFAEKDDKGNVERFDAYADRGIEFP